MSLAGIDAEGLHFVAGNRRLTYGPATWIDARHEAASAEPFAVSADPTGGYLVTYVWATRATRTACSAPMVGADGSVSHLPGFVIDDGVDWTVPTVTNPVIESAVFADGTHVVLYRDYLGRYVARIVNGVVQGNQRDVKIGADTDTAVHYLSAGNMNVLHVADNRVSRFGP